jgi:hypothetical protein
MDEGRVALDEYCDEDDDDQGEPDLDRGLPEHRQCDYDEDEQNLSVILAMCGRCDCEHVPFPDRANER